MPRAEHDSFCSVPFRACLSPLPSSPPSPRISTQIRRKSGSENGRGIERPGRHRGRGGGLQRLLRPVVPPQKRAPAKVRAIESHFSLVVRARQPEGGLPRWPLRGGRIRVSGLAGEGERGAGWWGWGGGWGEGEE